MSTVASRTFRSIPHRNAHDTWTAIVALLTQGRTGAAYNELMAVSGVASSLITDQTPRDAAIIVTCDGPRTRIYCLYDDDAIDGGDANEDKVGFDPLSGDWAVSLPCAAEELDWVRGALKKHSTRITARDSTEVNLFRHVSFNDASPRPVKTDGQLGLSVPEVPITVSPVGAPPAVERPAPAVTVPATNTETPATPDTVAAPVPTKSSWIIEE